MTRKIKTTMVEKNNSDGDDKGSNEPTTKTMMKVLKRIERRRTTVRKRKK